eukprot:c19577_g1_i1 orf=73-2610(-)
MMDPPMTVFTSESTQMSSYVSTSLPKRKRRPAGTPDPDAEVVALSPKTLMESDRYVCEICNQGFQRDQNLQMHRRRHKVPWKLLKRIDPEVRKRVYVCPDTSCLHHNPCHALGDLVGIKKHYRRKHSSMKQWECDKCSKAYAVQSDYKAHLKTCGTRGHCCDCGRVFSRVESFIEHQDTCAAARSKRGIASNSDHQTASLPSLAAAAPDADHSALMPTMPSNNAEKAVRNTYNHHSTAIMNLSLKHLANGQDGGIPPLTLLAQSTCPDVARNTHTCIMIAAKSPPTPASPVSSLPSAGAPAGDAQPSAANPAHQSAATDARISTWGTLQGYKSPHDPTLQLQQDKAELQLLPTKPHMNGLESSQSSVTWGKGITSTNSNTSAADSSPASVDRLTRKAWLDVPKKLNTGSLAVMSPCSKLQLSIGLCNQDDQSTCCGSSIPVQIMSGPAGDKQNNNEALNPRTTNLQPWLAWNSLEPAHRKHDAALAKVPLSSCTLAEKQGMITWSADAHQDAIQLELATRTDHHCTTKPSQTSMASTPHSADVYHELSIVDKVQQLKRQGQYLTCSRTAAAGFTDQDSSKIDQSKNGEHDGEMMNLLQVQRFCKAPSAGTREVANLPQCNSSCGSIATPEAADDQLDREQSNSLPGSTAEADPAAMRLQCAEKPNFLLETFMPGTAATQTVEVLLEKAREQLKRATAEKLEAEKAWREAKREREKAEEEVERAQRIREYNKMIMEKAAQHEGDNQQVVATRKPTYSSASSSPSSIANSQASPSSLQMKRNMHVGVLCSAPSFITCPTCHHTQILYPSPTSHMQATLFLASQAEPTSLASSTSHKLPSLPKPISDL